jgi:1,4-alpha-glucan branching enzyme
MSNLVRRFGRREDCSGQTTGAAVGPSEGQPQPLRDRALKQAARELLLAQSSDWPFILRTGTSPGYARKRVSEHLLRFTGISEQLLQSKIDEAWLAQIETQDNIFPELNYGHFA